MKEFGTPEWQEIASKMKDAEDFFEPLFGICEDAIVENDIEYEAVITAAGDGDVLILHLNESQKADAFAIIEAITDDTYINLICSAVPGMGAVLLKEVERLAKQEQHKNVTADALNDGLVEYYGKQGFVRKPRPAKYTGIVRDIFVTKPLLSGGRRKTRRRRPVGRNNLRILDNKILK